MLAIGLIVLTLGTIGFVFGIFQKVKAGRLTDAPLVRTGDVVRRGRAVAGPKGQISAQGSVACAQPLYAPLSGQPCLFYSIKCTAKWKEGDAEKTKVLDETKAAAQFTIDDGSGPVYIDARDGGDFDPTRRKSETQGTGLLGGVTGTELVFGHYRVNTPMLDIGTKYEVEEEYLPVVPRLYACGRLADQGPVITAPSWRQLIMSAKSRDELLASATKTAKVAIVAGASAFIVGAGMAAVGQFVLDEAGESATPLAPQSAVAKPLGTVSKAATAAKKK